MTSKVKFELETEIVLAVDAATGERSGSRAAVQAAGEKVESEAADPVALASVLSVTAGTNSGVQAEAEPVGSQV
jgi:hypothetical protein